MFLPFDWVLEKAKSRTPEVLDLLTNAMYLQIYGGGKQISLL